MVGSGVSLNQKIQLSYIEGCLTARHYVDEILQLVVSFLTQMSQGSIFQADNTRPHRGHI